MHVAGQRNSGRLLVLIVAIVLLFALVFIIIQRNNHQPSPENKPMRPESQLLRDALAS